MIHTTDDTTLIGIAELRTEMPKIAKNLKIKTVIVMKRGKPVGVLQDYALYEEKENLIEIFEDMVLGRLAKEREASAKEKDYISHEKVVKKILK